MVYPSYKRQFESSPIFQLTNSVALAAQSYWIVDLATDIPQAVKYLPFNQLAVSNVSNYVIRVYFNQGNRYVAVPANSTKIYDKESMPALNTAKVFNADSSNSIAAELISLEMQRVQYSSSDLIANIHQFINKRRL